MNEASRPPVRTLFVEPTSGRGGSARCLTRFAPKLSPYGVTPAVLAYRGGGRIRDLELGGVKVFDLGLPEPAPPDPFVPFFGLPLPSAAFVRICTGAARAIRTFRPRVLYLNTQLYSMLPVLSMGKLFGLRTVCHLRETIELTRAERLAFPHVDMFVTLTDEGRRFYSDQGLPEGRMRRVYDAVDSSIIVRDGCAKDPQLFTMGIIGALIPRKGHRYLLEAMAAQPASGPRIRLLIAGDGPVARELQTQCVVLGLQKHVEFLGYVDDVGAVLSRIDTLVVPSLQEGFSQVVLEAMSAGLPVIASALPGLDELVEEGRTGFLVPPANADALRRAIHKLASDPGLASELGRAARVRIDAGLFNPEREAEEIATVIHEAAARV